MNTYRPSTRPKVATVKKWETVFHEEMEYDWRGLGGGTVVVQLGYPYPDFYKVTSWMGFDHDKKIKYFYGEMAFHQVRMHVYDLGFRRVLEEMD